MKKWTWQWLGLLGLYGMIFLVATLFMDLEVDEPIPVFYQYPYSDVAWRRVGDTLLFYQKTRFHHLIGASFSDF